MQQTPAKEFPFSQTPVTTPKETIQSPLWSPSIVETVPSSSSSHSIATSASSDSNDFVINRDRLAESLDVATGLVKRLQSFNQDKWTIVYPSELGVSQGSSSSTRSMTAPSTPHKLATRSSSTFDRCTDGSPDSRPSTQRSYSTVDTPAARDRECQSIDSRSTEPTHPLSILALDLKLGHPTAPISTLPALLPSLSVNTLAQLLSRRLTTSTSQLSQLKNRVLDKQSRILVTGDLNAGKSTLVNALLRRDLMPYDQQPCTTVFCECLDAQTYNKGKQEIHALKDPTRYDVDDASTYDLYELDKLNEFQDMPDEYQMLKAYVTDARASSIEKDESEEPTANDSFIANGVVQTSLIDAPGLNRDTLSTTALFARQSEIDVIVFVVSAENHFTLSAKEFLWNAAREKAYIFVVVNKWSGIRDKARCMRIVGDQIRQLSPATWESRNELVHFVDAGDVLDASKSVDPSFERLELALRSFVLLKRSQSKLAPAKHYLTNLLSDLLVLADANISAATAERDAAQAELERVKPVHERLASQRQHVDDAVDKVEESTVTVVKKAAWQRLDRALSFVSQGQLVPPTRPDQTESDYSPLAGAEPPVPVPTQLPPYQGLFDIWSWAVDVKKTLVQALEAEIRAAEDVARSISADNVNKIVNDISQRFLPAAHQAEGADKSSDIVDRQFQPQVMFAKRRRGAGRLAARGLTSGLGIGASLRPRRPATPSRFPADSFEVSFFDLFDVERFVPLWRSSGAKQIEEDSLETGALISLGVGGIGMLGSRVIGIKGGLESLGRVFDVLGSPAARKWAAPVLGVCAAGLVVYTIVDLPRAVPANIGRRLALALQDAQDATGPPVTFASSHADRIASETRKVLRLASWDLRERYRAALEKSAAERRMVEEQLSRAKTAISWLDSYDQDVRKEQSAVSMIELAN